jgi:hypothetical protein
VAAAAAGVAVTRGVPAYGRTASRGVKVSSSNQTLPLPPCPAVIAISRVAVRRSVWSGVGPHAKLMWRRLRTTSVQRSGKRKSRRFTHQTFSPLASTSLNSRLLGGRSPRTRKPNSKFSG